MWTLVPPPDDHSIIGSKLIFKNKMVENGRSSRTVLGRWVKAIVKEWIMMKPLLWWLDLNPLGCCLSFYVITTLFCMKWMSKVAFLNEYIKEEIYAKQLPRFEDPKEPHYVYML